MKENLNDDTNDMGNLTTYERWLLTLGDWEHNEEIKDDNTYEDLEDIDIKNIVKNGKKYNKLDIILDCDNTLIKSNECAIKIYEQKTGTKSNGIIESYNFDKSMPLWNRQQQNDIFTSKEFYDKVELYDGCFEVLQKLHNKGHRLIIATITNTIANTYKRNMIKRLLPFINEVIQIDNFVDGDTTVRMNKDFIVGDLIIDDHVSNLKGNRSEYKLLFGDNLYSSNWTGDKASDWKQVDEYVEYIEMVKRGVL